MKKKYIDLYLKEIEKIEPTIYLEPLTLLCGVVFMKHVEHVTIKRGNQLILPNENFYITLVYHPTMDDVRLNSVYFPNTRFSVSSYFPLVVRGDGTIVRFDEKLYADIIKIVKK